MVNTGGDSSTALGISPAVSFYGNVTSPGIPSDAYIDGSLNMYVDESGDYYSDGGVVVVPFGFITSFSDIALGKNSTLAYPIEIAGGIAGDNIEVVIGVSLPPYAFIWTGASALVSHTYVLSPLDTIIDHSIRTYNGLGASTHTVELYRNSVLVDSVSYTVTVVDVSPNLSTITDDTGTIWSSSVGGDLTLSGPYPKTVSINRQNGVMDSDTYSISFQNGLVTTGSLAVDSGRIPVEMGADLEISSVVPGNDVMTITIFRTANPSLSETTNINLIIT